MKRIIVIVLLSVSSLAAQPGADPSSVPNDALKYDPANDFFLRGKNLYDLAQQTKDVMQRQAVFENAATVLRNYLNEYPQHANAERAWWYLGNSYYQSGQVDDARRCFAVLINGYKTGVWVAAAAYTLAADHYNRGEHALAAPLFETFANHIGKPSETARGFYFAGNCYRLLGRDHQALETLQKVIDHPEGAQYAPLAELAMGHISVKIGRVKDAHARFLALTEKEVSDAVRGEALLNAALTARQLDMKEVATPMLEAILRHPGMANFWPDAQTALMATYFEAEDYKKVLECFSSQQVKAADGDREAARLMIPARAHMRLRQYKEALEWFRQIERLVPPENDLAFKASYYRLLCFFQIEGQHVPDQVDAFLLLYRKSRPLDFRVHTALMMKAESLYGKGRIAEAAQVYNEVEASSVSDKNRAGLFYQRGWCLADAGDQPGAIRSLTEFITKYANDSRIPSALAKRARVYVESGKHSNAIADFDKLIEMGKPNEMVSLAWLESARLQRSNQQIEDMVQRYRGLLRDVKDLSNELKGEANYWIGWGLVKTNQPKDAIAYLEQARKIRPDLYQKHAGILLILGYFSSQDAVKLAAEVQLAIDGSYEKEIPAQALQWSGRQSYNAGDYAQAAKVLALIANPDDSRLTPKEVWRYLGKARIEIKQFETGLVAVNHALEVEDNPAWRADGLLDRARALLAMDKAEEARKAADEALAMQPQGRTRGSLRILMGDLEMKAGDPKKASAQYLIVVSFMDDDLLKPLALSKLVAAFEAQPDPVEAEKYRKQLQAEFPDWKAP